MRPRRVLGLAAALALVGAACTSSSGSLGSSGSSDVATAADTGDFDYSTVDYDAEPRESAVHGLRRHDSFPPPVVDPRLIRSGGPPPDGIPPIDDPVFASVPETTYLGDTEPVIAVEVDGDARAYPVQVLIWHEIVNDVIGGIPVTVTYCPLCNSAVAYERELGSRVLDFGTSGELYQSALVMYDRQTESLWAHFTGQGIVGHYAGAQLEIVPAQTLSWATFREVHPDGSVLTRDTGFSRRYGENPYVGYDDEAGRPIGAFLAGDVDERLPPKTRVIAVSDAAGSVAVRLADLVDAGVVALERGDRDLVAFHEAGLSSALDTQAIAEGRDVGQTGVFVAAAGDATPLSFRATAGGFEDAETGSTWDITGRATAGPLAGEQLEPVAHLDTFWFALATYRPDTVLLAP